MSLPKYQAYRDSGLPWLGEVPAHWDITRLRHCANVQTGIAKGKDNDGKQTVVVPYLRVANVQDGYLALSDVATIEVPPDVLSRYTLQYGDVLMNEGGDVDKLGRGCIWRDEIPDCIHQNHVFSVRPHAVSPEWLNLLTGSAYAQFYFMTRAKQSTNLASISSTNIMELPLVLPPKEEQAAITAFVDRETAKIDALVAEQEKLIALLAEKRQATISHAVTRGLNPDAPMKDSGVAWLGEVPAHWPLPPLYMRYSSELGKMLDASRITGRHLVPYLRNVDVQWDVINYSDLPAMDIEAGEYARYTVRNGDLLVCEGGEVGRAAVVQTAGEAIGYQKALHRLRALSPEEYPRYMFYTFAWASKAGAFAGEGQSTIAHLTGEQLRKYRFPRPPLSEQRSIAHFLDTELVKLTRLTTEAVRAITLLKERRSALIAAAVTGQIDVRGAVTMENP